MEKPQTFEFFDSQEEKKDFIKKFCSGELFEWIKNWVLENYFLLDNVNKLRNQEPFLLLNERKANELWPDIVYFALLRYKNKLMEPYEGMMRMYCEELAEEILENALQVSDTTESLFFYEGWKNYTKVDLNKKVESIRETLWKRVSGMLETALQKSQEDSSR